MKKLFFVIITLVVISNCITFSPIKVSAFSAYKYARIITDDTPFYSDSNGQNLVYYLPYTYYVKVLDDSQSLAHVECYKEGLLSLDGYVPKDMLFYDDFDTNYYYLDQHIFTSSTAILYSDIELKSSIQYVFSGRELTYYGSFPISDGQSVFYVGYNGKLGYVKETCIVPFTISLHPNPNTFLEDIFIPEKPSQNTPSSNQDSNNNDDFLSSNLKFIIIFALIFAGVISLIFVLSKKDSTKTKQSFIGYYDENDFE